MNKRGRANISKNSVIRFYGGFYGNFYIFFRPNFDGFLRGFFE